jgi:lipoprotein signal peptidase
MGIGSVRWYTFNVADAAISISIVLFIGMAIFGDRLTRTGRTASNSALRPARSASVVPL